MSLYQRGKSWYYDFVYRGQRYTGCIGLVSKTVAKEIEAKKKAEAVEQRYELPSKKPPPLFEVMAEEYLTYYRANRRPQSAQRHEVSYRALTRFFGGKRLSDITPFLIERYKRTRKEEGVSEVSINRELAFLKNLFTMAITWGKTETNPVKQVKLFREDNGRTRVLTEEEEVRLLAHCGPYLKPVVITALQTGFRKSELLSLTWENIDFQHRLITVDAAYAKNGEARTIPMNSFLTETLRVIKIGYDSKDPVFRNREGRSYRSFRTAFDTAVRRAGIPDFTFHDLRHTFASRLVMKGVDLTTVKELMGHKDITMTLRYAHLTPGHKRNAVELLSEPEQKVPSIFTTRGEKADPPWLPILENSICPRSSEG
ncbi:MAG: site-specific integrase [Candidatus Tectomicrobia bacterium]|nr:site-specific integrase [Candidatus Tectomicrobia bacterium]